jgi:hypothetical protein
MNKYEDIIIALMFIGIGTVLFLASIAYIFSWVIHNIQ